MQITLNIPEPFAERITQIAERHGITPTQWVTRAIIRATPDTAERPKRIGRPKVNEARDAAIRAKWAAGATHQQLADEYGIHRVRVVQICNGRDRLV